MQSLNLYRKKVCENRSLGERSRAPPSNRSTDEIAIKKRQSIFDLSLVRGRAARPEATRISGEVEGVF
jgi:hypothetical protein